LLNLRLQRTGKTGQPNFRIILQVHTASVKGKALEILGHYQPALNPKIFEVNVERVTYWIKQGAQPSDSLAGLLKRNGMEGMDKYIKPRNKKRPKKGEQPAAPAANAPAPEAKAPETPAA